jgi:hypothetical protein
MRADYQSGKDRMITDHITLVKAIAGNKNGIERLEARVASLDKQRSVLTDEKVKIEKEIAARRTMLNAMETLQTLLDADNETLTFLVPRDVA